MNPTENTEKWVKLKKPRITTSDQMDKQVLDDCFAAMEEAIQAKSADNKPNVWKITMASKITKLAAAAVIIVAIGFFIFQASITERADTGKISIVTRSPAEMLTLMSLTAAYRQGGIEAVDKQCDKAFEMLGPRQTVISVQQVIAELNGT